MSTRYGKYDLLGPLATGGMAEIWLARISGAAGFSKRVVIKRLLNRLAANPEYIEMFLDEGRLNSRFSHSNVVQVFELGQVEGRYFMAMEYIGGVTVSQLGKRATQRLGEVPQGIAAGIVAQACAGLHHAHERALPDGTPLKIVHRDVSPQNLIVSFEGTVKVADFGVAKAEGRQQAQTRAHHVKGKRSYLSPEQCLEQPVDRRSDVFGLGIVLFELCTSRRLFKRASPYAIYEAISHADVPRPSTLNSKITPEMEAVILRALALHAEDRFATAEELQDALEQAMRKAGLRGSPTDLQQFLATHFASEITAEQELLAQADRGELSQASSASTPFAEQARLEAFEEAATPPKEPATEIDLLPPLADDSLGALGQLPVVVDDPHPPPILRTQRLLPVSVRRAPIVYLLAALALGAALWLLVR